jgi:hypothetical protein
VEEKSPSVFSFLTPGMLPKLKNLHDRAKGRAVAYVLITNLIGKLDPAAIRNGRFDARLGIYPPDLLSRAGRLWSAAIRYQRNQQAQGKQAGLPDRQAVWMVASKTGGGPMNTLGRPGWFTAPKQISDRETNAFAALYANRELRAPEPEATRELLDFVSPAAKDEFQQWSWVDLWDASATAERDQDEVLTSSPTRAAVDEEYNQELLRRKVGPG